MAEAPKLNGMTSQLSEIADSHGGSWDEGRAISRQEHQTTGEDTTSGESAGISGSTQQHIQSWNGVLSSGVASDEIGGSHGNGSGSQSRPPLPPPPVVDKTSSYALRNQTFLKQAAAGALHASRSPGATAGKNQHSFASPSPNTKFRKRLAAIEEDDGQNSFVVIHKFVGGRGLQVRSGSASSAASPMTDAPSPPLHLDWYPIQATRSFLDEDSIQSRSLHLETDNLSVPSSGAGDSACGSPRLYDPFNNPLQIPGTDSDTAYHVPFNMDQMSRFEREQEERFHQKRHHIEQKLAAVLQQNSVAKDADRQAVINSYMEELDKEHAIMLAEWKEEMRRVESQTRQCSSWNGLIADCYESMIRPCWDSILSGLASIEVVLSNMPMTIGALGLSWVTMGTVWFKFVETMVDACDPTYYYGRRCSFLEFPGCFACDVNNPYYKAALHFHWFCSSVSALACVLFLAKMILAPNVVLDMLRNPTTSTPVGVWCIAMVCTFAGQHGVIGEAIVLVTSCFHVLLAFWFLYISIFKFRGLPDPGWFPNVVGISYAAVKTWIYFPVPGLIIMTLCTIFFLCTFFISVTRVALNSKIAAPVCWIQLSAPSITLYSLTLLGQPIPSEESLVETSPEEEHWFITTLQEYFLPVQHFFMLLTMIGLASALHSLWVQWPKFRQKPFSPAHVAFCFPTLSHTNAIQAYRAGLVSLSSPIVQSGSLFRTALFGYWCFFLSFGTILNLVFTYMYIVRIPEWTKPDLTGEEEPPAPAQTIVHEMMDETGAHETIRQPFLSPAVLEANEAGVLVRVKRGTDEYRLHGPFVRTRHVTSLGFDLMLSELELREERARLLDWVAKNAPRQRNRTLSDAGAVSRGIYGTFTREGGEEHDALVRGRGHVRSKTTSGAPFV